MRLQCFSVRDNAIGAFLPPFYARSTGEAIRSFMEAASNPEHQFAKHAKDYVLFSVGEFDDASGLFVPSEPGRVLSALESQAPDREA